MAHRNKTRPCLDIALDICLATQPLGTTSQMDTVPGICGQSSSLVSADFNSAETRCTVRAPFHIPCPHDSVRVHLTKLHLHFIDQNTQGTTKNALLTPIDLPPLPSHKLLVAHKVSRSIPGIWSPHWCVTLRNAWRATMALQTAAICPVTKLEFGYCVIMETHQRNTTRHATHCKSDTTHTHTTRQHKHRQGG